MGLSNEKSLIIFVVTQLLLLLISLFSCTNKLESSFSCDLFRVSSFCALKNDALFDEDSATGHGL